MRIIEPHPPSASEAPTWRRRLAHLLRWTRLRLGGGWGTPALILPRGWVVGGGVWLVLSLVVLRELGQQQGEGYLLDGWRLLSLLWCQFGLAGTLAAALRRGGGRIPLYLVITLLPPLLLYLLLVLFLLHP